MKVSQLDYTGVLLTFNEKHVRVISPNLIEAADGRKFDISNEDSPFVGDHSDPGHIGSILYSEVHVVGTAYAVTVQVGQKQLCFASGSVHSDKPADEGDITKLAEFLKPKERRIQAMQTHTPPSESFDSMSRFKRDALYAALVFQGLIPDKIEEAGFEFIYIYNVALECWIGLAFKDMPEDQGKSILSTISTADHLQATLAAYEAHGTVCFTGDDMINVIEMTVLKAYLYTENQNA